jgi:transcription antitermination factor NusG
MCPVRTNYRLNRQGEKQVDMSECPLAEAVVNSPEGDGTSWYGIQTLYRYEARMFRDLTAKGFVAYLPLLRETRQWSDRKKVIDVPAFSGYLFARHDASVRSRSRILETAGIVRMLPDNHKPVPIADIEIESLRLALASELPCTRCEIPAVGTMVAVKRGVLAGVRGQVSRVNNKFRLVLAVSSISQALSIEVDVNDVEAVEALAAAQSPLAMTSPLFPAKDYAERRV